MQFFDYVFILEENRQVRSNLNTLMEQLDQAGKHLNYSATLESSNTELQAKYKSVCAANEEMKVKVRELNNEIKKREQMAEQWNQTLHSVDTKLADLEAEKEGMHVLQFDSSKRLGNLRAPERER